MGRLPAGKVGIPALGNAGIPLDADVPVTLAEDGTGDAEGVGLVLNDERRFCADDFLRIVGRGPSAGPPDNAMISEGPENEDIIIEVG